MNKKAFTGLAFFAALLFIMAIAACGGGVAAMEFSSNNASAVAQGDGDGAAFACRWREEGSWVYMRRNVRPELGKSSFSSGDRISLSHLAIPSRAECEGWVGEGADEKSRELADDYRSRYGIGARR